MKKEIILELIPDHSNPEIGNIVQLSALKLEGLNLVGRFDYRINPDQVYLKDLVDMFSYDKEDFTYKNTNSEIMIDFIKWANDDNKLLVIDNSYTQNYLNHYNIKNEQVSVFSLLGMKYNDNIISDMVKKYGLQESNYIVDLIYEALIMESNINSKNMK